MVNGRWVLEDPAGLPEGTEIEIVTRPAPPTAAAGVYFDERLRPWVHALVSAAASPKYSASRGFPAASDEEEIVEGAKRNAHAAARAFAIPDDIKTAAAPVLARFIVVPFEAKTRGVTVDAVVRAILDETALP